MMSYSEIFLVSFVLGSKYRFHEVSITFLTPIIYKFITFNKFLKASCYLSYYLFYDKNYDIMDAKLLQGLQGKPKSIKLYEPIIKMSRGYVMRFYYGYDSETNKTHKKDVYLDKESF